VAGGRDAVQASALEYAKDIFYAGHNWHPYFLDGIKTIGYELWESLHFSVPDNIVVVAGAGSIALGCDAAFGELSRAGQIGSRPRLFLAQPGACRAIYDAFHFPERDPPAPHRPVETLAEGAAIPVPVRLGSVVAAVRRSGGSVVSVTEEEIATATRQLAAMGFYCEPTSAVSAAAVRRLIAIGAIERGQKTVVVLTGSGLKTDTTMSKIFG